MEALFDKVYNVTQNCHVHYFQKTTATNLSIFENSMHGFSQIFGFEISQYCLIFANNPKPKNTVCPLFYGHLGHWQVVWGCFVQTIVAGDHRGLSA